MNQRKKKLHPLSLPQPLTPECRRGVAVWELKLMDGWS